MADLFAPPSPEELRQATPVAPQAVTEPKQAAPAGDLFAPPSSQELQAVGKQPADLFAPPSPEELHQATGAGGGLVVPAVTKNADVEQIAAKHGVDPEDLKQLVSLYGGVKEDATAGDIPKIAAGVVQSGAAVGLPAWAYKKTQDPKMQQAMDDLSTLVGKNKSWAQAAGELGLSVVTGAGLEAGLGKAGLGVASKIVAPSLAGAAAGLGSSKTGEELSSAGVGGALGAAIPAGFIGAGKLARSSAAEAAATAGKAATKPLGPISQAATFFTDVAPTFDIFDKQLGTTSLGKTLADTSVRQNQLNNTLTALVKNNGGLRTAEQVDSFLAQAQQAAKQIGLKDIPDAPVLKSLDDTKQAFLAKYRANPVDPELVQALEQYTGQDVASRIDVDKAMQSVLADKGKLWRDAEQALPDPVSWLRETNPQNVARNLITKLERTNIEENLLPEVEKARQLAYDKDDFVVANYLDRYKKDLTYGTKTISDAAKEAVMAEWDKLVTNKVKGTSGLEKALWRAKGETPQAISNLLQASVYHNGIGLNLSSALQNMVSPYTTAISELGPDKATKYAVNAMLDLAKTVRDGVEVKAGPALAAKMGVQVGDTVKTRNPALVALNEGLMGEQWRGELLDPVVAGVKRSQLAQAVNTFNKVYGNVVMGPFQWAENQGRGVVAFMGKRMGQDIAENPDLIDGMVKSPSYRRVLHELVDQGADQTEINQQVVNYLNSHTMLNFDKMNMSEYGRKVGPLLRQYSKIPSFVAGRVVQTVHDRGLVSGAVEGTGLYLAPLAAYQLLDNLADTENNPRIKKIVGSEGFKNWAVASSLSPLADTRGGLLRSPLVRIGEQAFKSAKQAAGGEPEEGIAKLSDTVYNSVGPGAGVFRLLGEDIPALLENKAPDRTEPLVLKRRLETITGQ